MLKENDIVIMKLILHSSVVVPTLFDGSDSSILFVFSHLFSSLVWKKILTPMIHGCTVAVYLF